MIMRRCGYYREYWNCYKACCMFGFLFFVGFKMGQKALTTTRCPCLGSALGAIWLTLDYWFTYQECATLGK